MNEWLIFSFIGNNVKGCIDCFFSVCFIYLFCGHIEEGDSGSHGYCRVY